MENPPNTGKVDPALMGRAYLRATAPAPPEERGDAQLLCRLIEEANHASSMYALLAVKTRGTPHQRVLRRMAEEERDIERRLQADHYLLTGDTHPVKPWHPSAPYLLKALREQYGLEQERARLPLPPLAELPAISARHAAALREMLAKIMY